MPADGGVAFVLIQHLDPTRESLTAELIGMHTSMPVVQVADGTRAEANHVYVIPPNKYLSLHGGVLGLSTPTAPRSLRMAIDFFLHSLAEDQRENAIGIILSGTGTDGSLGLKEIKAAGGMTMVQDPETVQHDGMLRSAIAASGADYVLPAEEMPAALLGYVRHATVTVAATDAAAQDAVDPVGEAVTLIIRSLDNAATSSGSLRSPSTYSDMRSRCRRLMRRRMRRCSIAFL